ncbi:MAG: hypothetical protein M3Q75_13770 [Gemmatimonadota bacterium]|nr:hypothetical protein [Gemmatimonadota bacterium]
MSIASSDQHPAPTFALAAAIGVLFRRRIDSCPGAWVAALGLFWLAFYVFYFVRVGGPRPREPDDWISPGSPLPLILVGN